MTKVEIKHIFKDHNIQLGKGALEMIVHQLKAEVSKMAIRSQKGNLKRLTPELFYVALGRLKNA